MTKTNKFIASTCVAFVATLTLMPLAGADCGACGAAAHSHAEDHAHSIVDIAKEAGSFSTLLAAASAAGLAETLHEDGPYTVFAPTDEAFAKLPEGTVEALLEDTDKLRNILLYHVVPGEVYAKDVMGLTSAKSAMGQSLNINTESGVRIDNAQVVKADVQASNGVIHVIDHVILPDDIVGIAAGNKQFSTLVAAIKAAGLVDTLSAGGPFTVFAPTNEAFANLPDGTVENLLKPENKKQLQDVLKYHVVSGTVNAEEAMKLTKAKTVQGGHLAISMCEKEGLHVDEARVISADIAALNGVIHVIDTVVLPKG